LNLCFRIEEGEILGRYGTWLESAVEKKKRKDFASERYAFFLKAMRQCSTVTLTNSFILGSLVARGINKR
jgi:hypothetical protein